MTSGVWRCTVVGRPGFAHLDAKAYRPRRRVDENRQERGRLTGVDDEVPGRSKPLEELKLPGSQLGYHPG